MPGSTIRGEDNGCVTETSDRQFLMAESGQDQYQDNSNKLLNPP